MLKTLHLLLKRSWFHFFKLRSWYNYSLLLLKNSFRMLFGWLLSWNFSLSFFLWLIIIWTSMIVSNDFWKLWEYLFIEDRIFLQDVALFWFFAGEIKGDKNNCDCIISKVKHSLFGFNQIGNKSKWFCEISKIVCFLSR